MKRVLHHAANRLWNLSLQREARAYWKSLGNLEATQEQLLLEMLNRNRGTAFGRQHGFARIRSAREYQDTVPLAEYGDLESFIERICAGEPNVLTAEPVLLMEPTGGSSGGSKLIPCTRELKRQFQRGIAPWITDLYRSYPDLLNGKSYWSVSPVTRRQTTAGGIAIGFDDDSEYAGGIGRWLVRSVQAVPDQVKYIGEMESFWYVTILFLLRCRDLTLISIWNPSFLTILCSHLQDSWPLLAEDISMGTLSPPVPLEPEVAAQLSRNLRPDPMRAEEIRSAFMGDQSPAEQHQCLWPNLRLISCWCDGAATELAGELHGLFPQAVIQGKGLLATEGFFTLPVVGMAGCLPALRSHFLEFIQQDGGDVLLLHQLEAGSTYSMVATTAGGLYRYRLHDLLTVTGFHNSVPLLRFMGKEDHIADHFGEKLHEAHVCNVMKQVAAQHELVPSFAMLACEKQPEPGYVYFVESPNIGDGQLLQIVTEIDKQLRANFHYGYCRDLGQLAAIRVFRIDRNGCESYLQECCRRGQRLGDAKPISLHRGSDWTDVFQGRMVESA